MRPLRQQPGRGEADFGIVAALLVVQHGRSAAGTGAIAIGSRLHVWVRDTGIGIAEEDFANLGKPVTQIHNDYTRRFEGTGLGLSLVKGLVALHEGTMSIESMPGEGTTVTISLPVNGPKGRPANEAGVLTMPVTRAKGDRNGSLRKTA